MVLFCLLSCSAYGQLEARLQQLRQNDDLSGWLYERMAYVAGDPSNRIAVLMNSEKEAWRSIRTDEDYLAWLDLLVNQGYYQLYTGNILLSIQCYEKAYAFYKQTLPDPYDAADHILKPLGNNYTRLGDYESALYIQEQLLSLALTKKDNDLIAAAYANMAVLRRSQGERSQAAQLAQMGLKYARGAVSGLLLNTLSEVTSTDSAKQLNALAIRLLKDNDYWLESAYVQAGQIADNPDAAVQYYKLALNLLKDGRQREKANVHTLIGKALLGLHQWEQARQQYLLALKMLLPRMKSSPEEYQLYGDYVLQDALEGLANAYHGLGQLTEALNTIDLCFAAAAKLRSEFAGKDSRSLQQQENRRRVELAMDISYSLYLRTHDKQYANRMLQYAEQGKAQWLLDEIRRNISYAAMRGKDTLFRRMQQVEQAIAYYKSENTGSKETVSSLEYEMSGLQRKLQKRYPALQSNRVTGSLLQQLPDNMIVIACFAGEKKWFFLEGDKTGIKDIRIIDTMYAGCRNFVQHYFREGPSAMINNPSQYKSDAYGLYHSLFGNKNWSSASKYLLLTDDVLGYIPFDALVTDDGSYLLKKASVSYAYSLLSWQQLMKHRERSDGSFTGFFMTHDGAKAIPAVIKEQQQLMAIISGSFNENKEATLNALERSLARNGVVHVSSHAGVQNEPVLEMYDGAFALSGLTARLHAPQLVVLSACRTADGSLMQGEGVQSLSRGFAAAGIPGVVAGLWNVNDAGAATFMPRFYENLRAGHLVDDALHQAKLQWLAQQSDPVLQLPYYWGGWVYIGTPQTVLLKAPVPIYWWIAGAVILLAIFCLFYLYKK